MRIVRELPEAVRVVRHVWIPMRDGVRLSARIWLPEDAEHDPAPAILEYIPYRKDDRPLAGDEPRHRYWRATATRACASTCAAAATPTGILEDEYLPQEQDDAVRGDRLARRAAVVHGPRRHDRHVVGRLQRPAGRRAAAARSCRRSSASARPTTATPTTSTTWAARCSASTCSPGRRRCSRTTRARRTRRSSATRWREIWLRAAASARRRSIEDWLSHQRRDAFWKHGSVVRGLRRDPGARCTWSAAGPTRYPNAILALARAALRRAAQGPHRAVGAQLSRRSAGPGPAIGFLQECVRWFDHWFKDDARTAIDRRAAAARLDAGAVPRRAAPRRSAPGRWVAEPSWPPPRRRRRLCCTWRAERLEPTRHRRRRPRAPATRRTWRGPRRHLVRPAGRRRPAADQRTEDGRSLCFDAEAAGRERLEILGGRASSSSCRPTGRSRWSRCGSCDVAPGRRLAAVTPRRPQPHAPRLARGAAPLEPGRRYQVRVPLGATGTASRPATACASRLRPPTGRASGPRPSRSRSRCTQPARAASSCRCERSSAANEAAPAPFAEPETGAPLPVEAVPGIYRAGDRELARHRDGPHRTRVYRDNPAERIIESGIEIEHLMTTRTRSSTAIRSRRPPCCSTTASGAATGTRASTP